MVIAELLLQRMLARYRFVFLVGEFPLFGEAELSVFGQVRMYRLEVLVDWGLVNGWLFVVVFLVTIVLVLPFVVDGPWCLSPPASRSGSMGRSGKCVETTGRPWFLRSIPRSCASRARLEAVWFSPVKV